MAGELIAQIPIETEMVEEVVALEDPVLLYHPVVALGHERLDDRRPDVRMVVGRERVADVVEQRARDVLVIPIGAIRARRRLQRVREPVDVEPAVVPVEEAQVIHHAVGEAGVVPELRLRDALPVEPSALGHRSELSPGCDGVTHVTQSAPRNAWTVSQATCHDAPVQTPRR